MTPEESGRWLLERMRQHVGFSDYADIHLLDFGCGVRFSQAILNTGLNIGSYTGVDNYAEMIAFLARAVTDSRCSYVFFDAHHAIYNPKGRPIGQHASLPLNAGAYDVVSMFSVITHQSPEESTAIFTLLRKHVKAEGHLFFTCFLDETIASFEDRSPAGLTGERCYYNPSFLTAMVAECGWEEVRRAPAEGPLIGDSFVFRAV